MADVVAAAAAEAANSAVHAASGGAAPPSHVAAMEPARSAEVLRAIAADAQDVALKATHHAEARGRAAAVWTAGPPHAHAADGPRWTNAE